MHIRLKVSSGGERTYRIKIEEKESVSRLKSRLLDEILPRENCIGKRVRLIYRGRLLQDDEVCADEIREKEEVVHCVLSDDRKTGHHSIDVEDEEENDDSQEAGFDQLRQHGFSGSEISDMRSLFSLELRNMEERSPRVEGESQTQRRRRMERLWVETHIQRLLAASPNENSTDIASFRSNRSELMLGAVLGFILGFIVMFWVRRMFFFSGTSPLRVNKTFVRSYERQHVFINDAPFYSPPRLLNVL